jgi:hypothetical protein
MLNNGATQMKGSRLRYTCLIKPKHSVRGTARTHLTASLNSRPVSATAWRKRSSSSWLEDDSFHLAAVKCELASVVWLRVCARVRG